MSSPGLMNTARNAYYEFRFTSRDGFRIVFNPWQSHEPAPGAIQIAHGLGKHHGRSSGLITDFKHAGRVVYATDHRGHGRTPACPLHFQDFEEGGFDLLVQDMVVPNVSHDFYAGARHETLNQGEVRANLLAWL